MHVSQATANVISREKTTFSDCHTSRNWRRTHSCARTSTRTKLNPTKNTRPIVQHTKGRQYNRRKADNATDNTTQPQGQTIHQTQGQTHTTDSKQTIQHTHKADNTTHTGQTIHLTQGQAIQHTLRKYNATLIHSFNHYGDLYSAPSRLLLRSAPDPCTAKRKSFKARVEYYKELHRNNKLLNFSIAKV